MEKAEGLENSPSQISNLEQAERYGEEPSRIDNIRSETRAPNRPAHGIAERINLRRLSFNTGKRGTLRTS